MTLFRLCILRTQLESRLRATLIILLSVIPIAVAVQSPAAEPPRQPVHTSKSLADELPRVPPVGGDKALKTFDVQGGFHLELVAIEPQVASPVDACFDADGRLYVAEMRDYPFSWEPTKLNPHGGGPKDAGTVRLLLDTDGDGKFDRSTIFADKITWPTSVCCYDGGVFVLAPPHLHYFKDTDGDGVANVRKIVLSGFGRDNVQAVANNLKWSLDNRIVFAAGRNGGALSHNGKQIYEIHGQDISFDPAALLSEGDPESSALGSVTGGEQFGLSFDDWGNRYVCNNSNHIEQVLFEDRYLRRNPYAPGSPAIRTIAKEGPAAPVFRRSPPEPWRVVRTRRRVSDPKMVRSLPFTEQFAVGYFTSAAGVTIYRGDAYPAAFSGNAFIGDVGGNLVHRKRVTNNGPLSMAERTEPHCEFLASNDNWFRPVNFVNGPDGCLYVLDMYRETIEHPFSIPDDIKSHLDLQSGADRGRIYRLVPPRFVARGSRRLSRESSSQLVAELASTNAWNRETAQRLLVERGSASVRPALQTLAAAGGKHRALGRLHALYTLSGLHALSDETLIASLHDPDSRIRVHALRLCEPRLKQASGLLEGAIGLVHDSQPRVRFQLALTLGEAEPRAAIAPLAELASVADQDDILRAALMTAVVSNADEIASRILHQDRVVNSPRSNVVLSDLAHIVGAQPDASRAVRLLKQAFATPNSSLQLAVLTSLARGLSRRGSSVKAILAESEDGDLQKAAEKLFRRAATTAADPSQRVADRTAAIGLLAFAPFDLAAPPLQGLLSPQSPPALQMAAVSALSAQTDRRVGKQLLEGWKSLAPRVRREVVDALTRTTSRMNDLLDAIQARQVAAGEIERDIKQMLTNYRDGAIRRRARQLFGSDLPANRGTAVAAYRAALERPGSPERGNAVYRQRCATCHRVNGEGHAVGPDLASVQNKSPADLLVAILDPNREAQPNYVAYTLVTKQGTVSTGLIAAESAGAITLRRAEGKEEEVLRSQVEELTSTGKSLMPEGFEKDISPEAMSDLLAFLKTLRAAATR